MTAVTMKPLSTTAASLHGFDNESCHLLIMGKEGIDPGLASLSHNGKVSLLLSSSSVSDLTSESSTARDLTISSSTESSHNVARGADSGQWRTGNSTKSSSSSDGPAAGGGTRARRRRFARGNISVDSRDTADILAAHQLPQRDADSSTLGSGDTAEIMAALRRRPQGPSRWRKVRSKLLAVARFRWMLTRVRRLEGLRRVLDCAAGALIIDELVVREVAGHLGLLPLLSLDLGLERRVRIGKRG